MVKKLIINTKLPIVISLFAGCGGSSLGYKLAGFNGLLAVEWDQNAVNTFKLNFSNIPVYHGDITKFTSKHCMELGKIKKYELDILDGSPPCQGFSMAGKRKFNDPRNSLFIEFIRLLTDLQPKIFVMENVSGLIKGYMQQQYIIIMNSLRNCGYICEAKLMNTMFFNVPQSRERVIIIGVRNDLCKKPSFPKPQSKLITFRQAVIGLNEATSERLIIHNYLLKYAQVHPGGWSTNTNIYKLIKGNIAGSRSTNWCEWDQVCKTICKTEIASSGIIHPNKKRYLNLSEFKRLASFPDNFKFENRKIGLACIGNCVPPNFMKAIAEHIKMNILNKIK